MGVLDTLSKHLVLLICATPLIGATVVAAVARCGTSAVRRAAFASVAVSGLLAVLMVLNYDPSARWPSGKSQTLQMVTRLRWLAEVHLESITERDSRAKSMRERLSGPNVEFAVGVDGVSLWFVALSVGLMVPVVLSAGHEPAPCPAAFYALLLVMQAATATLFAALDAALFAFCLAGILVPLMFLVGVWGRYERRRAIGRLMLFHFSGSLLVLMGLAGTVMAHHRLRSLANDGVHAATFSIEQLTVGSGDLQSIDALSESDEVAWDFWRQSQGWIFWSLLVGFAICGSLVPFHAWLASASAEGPTGVRIYLLGILVSVGVYGFLRFLLPIFPERCLVFSRSFEFAAAFCVVYASLWALSQREGLKLIAGWCIARMGLAAAGIFSLNSAGLAGAIVGLVGHGLSAACLVSIVSWIEEQRRLPQNAANLTSGTHTSMLLAGLCLGLLAAVGVPGTAGFAGNVMTFVGIVGGNAAVAGDFVIVLWMLFALLVLAWAFIRQFQNSIANLHMLNAPQITVTRKIGGTRVQRLQTVPARASRLVPVGAGLGIANQIWDTADEVSTDAVHEFVNPDTGARSELDWVGRRPQVTPTRRRRAGFASVLALLFAANVAVGLYPEMIVSRLEPSLERILAPYPSAQNRQADKSDRGQPASRPKKTTARKL